MSKRILAEANGHTNPISMGDIHNLYIGLTTLEKDESVKLTGEVRLKVAINLNRLRPYAEAYETARTKVFAEIGKRYARAAAETEGKGSAVKLTVAEHECERADEDQKLRRKEEHVELRSLLQSDLRLEENPRITGAMMALIFPILEGVE